MTAATRSDRQLAEAANRVSDWSTLGTRTVRIYPSPDGGADLCLAGVDRHFPSVLAAAREVEALGLNADVQPFSPTPLVLAQAP